MSSTNKPKDSDEFDDLSYEETKEMSPNELMKIAPVRHHPSRRKPTEGMKPYDSTDEFDDE
jgi:hypothetical protein